MHFTGTLLRLFPGAEMTFFIFWAPRLKKKTIIKRRAAREGETDVIGYHCPLEGRTENSQNISIFNRIEGSKGDR